MNSHISLAQGSAAWALNHKNRAVWLSLAFSRSAPSSASWCCPPSQTRALSSCVHYRSLPHNHKDLAIIPYHLYFNAHWVFSSRTLHEMVLRLRRFPIVASEQQWPSSIWTPFILLPINIKEDACHSNTYHTSISPIKVSSKIIVLTVQRNNIKLG